MHNYLLIKEFPNFKITCKVKDVPALHGSWKILHGEERNWQLSSTKNVMGVGINYKYIISILQCSKL